MDEEVGSIFGRTKGKRNHRSHISKFARPRSHRRLVPFVSLTLVEAVITGEEGVYSCQLGYVRYPNLDKINEIRQQSCAYIVKSHRSIHIRCLQ